MCKNNCGAIYARLLAFAGTVPGSIYKISVTESAWGERKWVNKGGSLGGRDLLFTVHHLYLLMVTVCRYYLFKQ